MSSSYRRNTTSSLYLIIKDDGNNSNNSNNNNSNNNNLDYKEDRINNNKDNLDRIYNFKDNNNDNNNNNNADNTKEHDKKIILIIFGFDITNLSTLIQFIILFGGLLLFMCLYGYYQELVIYGWFDRKLSLFTTFIHFFICSCFAHIHRYIYIYHLTIYKLTIYLSIELFLLHLRFYYHH
jgi:hypothetical protein